MRRLMGLIAALLQIQLFTLVSAEPMHSTAPLPGYTLHVSAEDIMVFATRSVKANPVGIITPEHGSSVQVISVTDDWCHISFDSEHGRLYGYLPLSYFDVVPLATPTPPPSVSYQPGTEAWVLNSSSGYRLNLRQDPRSLAKSEGKYYTGTPVTLTGLVENAFAQVLVAGTTLGWMDIRYLTTSAASFVPEMPIVTVKGSSAVLRSGPGTDYSRIARFDRGTHVTVLGVRSDGWYHVLVGDQAGYMADTLVSGRVPFGYGMDSDNPSMTNQASDQSSVFYINTYSGDGQLHLRESASAAAKSLGMFYTGVPLTVLNYTRTGWTYVRIGQTEGYMAADYITTAQPQHYGSVCTIQNDHATGLNLREAPSTGGALLAFAPNNSKVTLLGRLNNNWCYVDYNGNLGYMLDQGSLKQTK